MNAAPDGVASTADRSRGWVSPAVTVRILHVVLWLLVVSGPAAVIFVVGKLAVLDARVAAVATRPAAETAVDTSGAEGFAELFVASSLAATAEFSGGVDSPLGDSSVAVQPGAWFATSTVSLGAQEVGPGYYAVTVAAEVVAHITGPDGTITSVPVGTRFFSVGVAETGHGWTATGLPSLIADPVGVGSGVLPRPRRTAGLQPVPPPPLEPRRCRLHRNALHPA